MRLLTQAPLPRQEAGLPVRTLLRPRASPPSRQLSGQAEMAARRRRPETADPRPCDLHPHRGRRRAGGGASPSLPEKTPTSARRPIRWRARSWRKKPGSFLLPNTQPAGIAVRPSALTEETVTVAGAVCHYLPHQAGFHRVNRLDRGTTRRRGRGQKTGYIHRLCCGVSFTPIPSSGSTGACCLGTPQPSSGAIESAHQPGPQALCSAAPWTLWACPPNALRDPSGGAVPATRLCLGRSRAQPAAAPPLRRGPPAGRGIGSTAPRTPPYSPSGVGPHPSPGRLQPVTRRWLDVAAPLPEDMRRLLPPDCDPA